MPALLVAGVIGWSIGFLCAIQWKIVDPRTRRERRSDARWWRRWRARQRKLTERFGVENVKGRG